MTSRDHDDPATIDESARELAKRRKRLLGGAYRLFYPSNPIHVVRASGVWLYDESDNAYLDAYNNVPCVGHCHPKVVAALCEQAAILNTHTRYLSTVILEYAERLLDAHGPQLGNVIFTCTGSEANDLAYRIARTATGGAGFIVTRFAYHGVTQAISELSPSLGEGVPLGATTRTVPAPDGYRNEDGDPGERFAGHVREAIEDLNAHGIRPAGLLVDTIFSSDGIFSDPAGFLAPAIAAIHDAGGLFIADEVQAGFGRTGESMWGYARHVVAPDIVTMGKPMGNGHPIAGVVARPELIEAFGRRSRYFNTFGGNPVSCAVGLAVLDVLDEEGLLANARDVGVYLTDQLRTMAGSHELIGDVRGAGLFVGVELVTDRVTREPATAAAETVVDGLRERRILISTTGPGANVLKIRPPLVFSRDHAERLLDGLDAALAEVESSR